MGNEKSTLFCRWHGYWKSDNKNSFGKIITNYSRELEDVDKIMKLQFVLYYDEKSDREIPLEKFDATINLTKFDIPDKYFLIVEADTHIFKAHITDSKNFEGLYYSYNDYGKFSMVLN